MGHQVLKCGNIGLFVSKHRKLSACSLISDVELSLTLHWMPQNMTHAQRTLYDQIHPDVTVARPTKDGLT